MRCIPPLLLFLCAAACAQLTVPPPDDLLDAGHCIAAAPQDWFGIAQNHPLDLELGFVADAKAAHGDDLLYIVNYITPTHSAGMVYTLLAQGKEPVHNFLSRGKESHRVLQLQYRTAFHQADDGSEQVQLVDPPLGGIWTQDGILAAIHQVGFHTWTIPVADLQNRTTTVQCESGPDVE